MARIQITILVIALIGIAAAFFSPAVPHQVAVVQNDEMDMTFIDDELDNHVIPSDKSIHPARKCGFCMG